MALIKDPSLTPDEHTLRDRISDISEKCWSASWELGTEFEVWRLATEGGTWGRGSATELHADLVGLLDLARRLDRWIVWRSDDDTDHQAVDLREWERRYAVWRPDQG
jgi:hypothetical protein